MKYCTETKPLKTFTVRVDRPQKHIFAPLRNLSMLRCVKMTFLEWTDAKYPPWASLQVIT